MRRSTLLLSFAATSFAGLHAQGSLEALQVAVDLGLAAPPATAPAPNQPGPAVNEELFYKFDEGGGTRAINFVSGSAPIEGQIVSSTPTSWVPGKFNTALAAGTITPTATFNRVETGWAPGQLTNSDLTVAAFLRLGNNHPAPSLTYVFGVPTAFEFRAFTGATQLLISNWGGSPSTLRTTASVYGLASVNWVHVALVIDTTAATATFYIDGVPEAPIPITGGFSSNVTAFNVGQQIPTLAASIYEIDDFRLLTRAASPSEVFAWAQASTAADGPYGQGCGGTLVGINSPPVLGNANYGLGVTGTAGAVGALAIGASRNLLGGIPLPFDMGLLFPSLNGCNWETSAEVTVPIALGAGATSVPLPVPNSIFLQHRSLYAQAFLLAGSTPGTSNPFAISLEP